MSSPELYGRRDLGSERITERADQLLTSPMLENPPFTTPLFEAAGWDHLDGHAWESFSNDRQVEVSYINAGTCPDCGNGMIRLGLCMTCPCCGYGSCGE